MRRDSQYQVKVVENWVAYLLYQRDGPSLFLIVPHSLLSSRARLLQCRILESKSLWLGITTLVRRKANAIKVEGRVTIGNLSHICIYKPIIILNLVVTFNRDLKGLVPVGNHCLVAGKDILKVPWDCVPWTYHPILFWKRLRRVLGFDHPKAKSVSWPQWMHQVSRFDELMSELTRLMTPLSNRLAWFRQYDQREKLSWRSYPTATEALSTLINDYPRFK